MQEQYIVEVSLSSAGGLNLSIYDSENYEEYIRAHILRATGAFPGEVHKACKGILNDISQKCFFTEYFRREQSKRILHYITETYGAEPDFLWKNLPECAARSRKKAVAVMGNVAQSKFGLTERGTVEVINLKDEPASVAAHIHAHIAFPVYHMNKQHWYSIFLDNRLPDKESIFLITTNYILVTTHNAPNQVCYMRKFRAQK